VTRSIILTPTHPEENRRLVRKKVDKVQENIKVPAKKMAGFFFLKKNCLRLRLPSPSSRPGPWMFFKKKKKPVHA
jgi:hypothetical protein